MERMWQQVAEDARKESEAALQAAASRQQELNAARDELRHAQDRITELTALEANWRRRTEAAQQQVRMLHRLCCSLISCLAAQFSAVAQARRAVRGSALRHQVAAYLQLPATTVWLLPSPVLQCSSCSYQHVCLWCVCLSV
jgi:hypothetical protein